MRFKDDMKRAGRLRHHVRSARFMKNPAKKLTFNDRPVNLPYKKKIMSKMTTNQSARKNNKLPVKEKPLAWGAAMVGKNGMTLNETAGPTRLPCGWSIETYVS